jgi:hypothetical protein
MGTFWRKILLPFWNGGKIYVAIEKKAKSIEGNLLKIPYKGNLPKKGEKGGDQFRRRREKSPE